VNEQGADLLKPQRDVGVPPHLEIIFKRGHRAIPSHMSSGSVTDPGYLPSVFSKTFNECMDGSENRASASPRRTN
jgi:hypothetical protein